MYPGEKEEDVKSIESLLEKVKDYGKTSLELVKLQTLEKTSNVVSSFIPHSLVFILIASFLVFLNLGIAFWLGQILGEIYFGFFVVTAFYGIAGIVVHFFMHNWLKRIIRDYIIKLVLK
jgi:hypothetical protein